MELAIPIFVQVIVFPNVNDETPLSVVIADPDRDRADFISASISQMGGVLAARVRSTDEISQAVRENGPQIVLAAIDSADSESLNPIKRDLGNWGCPLVVYGGSCDHESIARAIEAGVSAYVTEDICKRDIEPIIRLALARFRKYKSLDDELRTLRERFDERSMVDKAKALLMRQHGLDESSAHQTLQQLAMNQRISLRAAAGNVVAMLSVISRK